MSGAVTARATARGVLSVHLFGSPLVEYGERRISFGSRPRVITLLAFLIVRRGRPIGRDEAAFALWPDATESAARAELRRYLNVLDAALDAAGASSPIVREGRTLRFDLAARVSVDALLFEDAPDDALEGAVTTFGPFLNGFDDEWIVAERERLQALYLQALDRLAARAQAAGELRTALRWTSTLQRADPLREETVRALMRTHLALGDRAAALSAYRDFRSLLRRELDVEPMAATTALHASVVEADRSTHLPAAEGAATDGAVRRAMLADAQDGDRPRALRRYEEFERGLASLGARPEPATETLVASLRDLAAIVPPWTARDVLPNNLPVFVTSLIGRDDDLEQIAGLLRASRLVTVFGGAGLGKTRAACAVAEHVLRERHDGAYFVDLSDVARDDAVSARIARATGFDVPAGADPMDTLSAGLRDRHLLLVVDNCEHVLAGATRCVDVLLRRCSKLVILATSRALLFLEGERAYDLPPLPVPLDGSSPTYAEALAIPSVALFAARYATSERRAREVRARLPEMLAICLHVDGVPLALELAARAGLHEDLRVLLASLRSGEGRRGHADSHDGRWKTLADALDWSMRLLDDVSLRLLENVSLFSGTFTLDGAHAVTGAAVSAVARGLAALCDKSLLVAESVDPPAYRFLAPMREHARERFATTPHAAAARGRFAEYFVEVAARFERDFGRLPTLGWVSEFGSAAADLESVLDLALVDAIDVRAAFKLLPAMRGYWYATDPTRGLQWLQRFEERVMRDGSELDRGRFLSTRGGLLGALGNASEALGIAEKAVAYLRSSSEPRALGIALRDLGDALGILGDERAGAAYAEATEIFRTVDDRARLASTLAQRGIYAYNSGDVDEARRYYRESRELAEGIAELRSFASATTGLGELEFSVGNVDLAIELATAAIAAFRQLRSDVGLWVTLANRSGYHLALENLDDARVDLHAALEPLERTGSEVWIALAMQQAAAIAYLRDAPTAATLLGFSAARVRVFDIHREPVGERQYRDLLAKLEVHDDPALRRHYERGEVLSDGEALAIARQATTSPASTGSRSQA